jgi:hypothetical protein
MTAVDSSPSPGCAGPVSHPSAGISPGGLRSHWQTKDHVVLLTQSLMLKSADDAHAQ